MLLAWQAVFPTIKGEGRSLLGYSWKHDWSQSCATVFLRYDSENAASSDTQSTGVLGVGALLAAVGVMAVTASTASPVENPEHVQRRSEPASLRAHDSVAKGIENPARLPQSITEIQTLRARALASKFLNTCDTAGNREMRLRRLRKQQRRSDERRRLPIIIRNMSARACSSSHFRSGQSWFFRPLLHRWICSLFCMQHP